MAFRFRKRIKIAPGVHLNIGKKGVSTSFGMRGASITTGSRGTYLNTSIPGTGLYNRQKIGGKFSRLLEEDDANLYRKFLVDIYRFASITAKADNTLTDEEADSSKRRSPNPASFFCKKLTFICTIQK